MLIFNFVHLDKYNIIINMNYRECTVITLLCIVAIYYLVIQGNVDMCVYYLKSKLYNFSNQGIPLPDDIFNYINKYLDNIPDIYSYRFIDFGCGQGKLIGRFIDKFYSLHGIELDKKLEMESQKYTKCVKCKHVSTFNMNMLDYKFEDCNTILYAYDPLFSMGIDSKIKLYYKLFNNIKNSIINSKVYFIFINSISRDDIINLDKYGLHLINKIKIGAILFNRIICIFKK